MADEPRNAIAVPIAGTLKARRAPRKGFLKLVVQKPLGSFGALLVVVIILVAVFAQQIAPFDPIGQDHEELVSPSLQHLAGTDRYGRDMFSRLVWGARVSLYVACLSQGAGVTMGLIVGLICGYWVGKLDFVVQRAMDLMMAFPGLILALSIMVILGASTNNVIIAISILAIPGVSRVVRGAVLSQKENQYVEAAKAIGCGNFRILIRHIFPNVTAPVIILVTVGLGSAILSEASLSFLGLGTPSPNPSWGIDLTVSQQMFWVQAPWIAIFPGLAITLAVLGFNLLGDALRDILDPRLRSA